MHKQQEHVIRGNSLYKKKKKKQGGDRVSIYPGVMGKHVYRVSIYRTKISIQRFPWDYIWLHKQGG